MMKKIFSIFLIAIFLSPVSLLHAHQSQPRQMFRGMHQSTSQQSLRIQPAQSSAVQIITPCPFAKIDKRYQKALQKIANSSLSQPLRNLLSMQAAENKDLAVKQTEERMRLCTKQACERFSCREELLNNPQAIKILKAVDKIAE